MSRMFYGLKSGRSIIFNVNVFDVGFTLLGGT
jgi:hypothetical protein